MQGDCSESQSRGKILASRVAGDGFDSGHEDGVNWDFEAQRVVKRVRQKLSGQEDPTSESLGVTGHVQQLISAATNEEYLATMFDGWAAFA